VGANLGQLYLVLNSAPEAFKSLRESLGAAMKSGDAHSELSSLHGLGMAYEHLKNNADAIKCYEKVMRISKPKGLGEDFRVFALGRLAPTDESATVFTNRIAKGCNFFHHDRPREYSLW
jgi:hypothetical protein